MHYIHLFLQGTRGMHMVSDIKSGSHLEFPWSLPPPDYELSISEIWSEKNFEL